MNIRRVRESRGNMKRVKIRRKDTRKIRSRTRRIKMEIRTSSFCCQQEISKIRRIK